MQVLKLIATMLFVPSLAYGDQEGSRQEPLLTWIEYMLISKRYEKYTPPIDISKNGCKAGTLITFSQKIEAIVAKVGSWNHPKDLFRSKDFLVMYRHSSYYWEECIAYLMNPSYSEEQKQIAIYAMEKLYIDTYLPYLEGCCLLYTTGQLTASLLSKIIYSDLLSPHPLLLFKNTRFYGEKIATCLEKLRTRPNLPKELDLAIKQLYAKEPISQSEFEFEREIERARKGFMYDTYRMYCSHNYPFKFSEIIRDAYQEYLGYEEGRLELDCYWEFNYSLSDLIIIMDHPRHYGDMHTEGDEDSATFFLGLRKYTEQERRLAIFAMHQLEGSTYHRLLNEVNRVYRIKAISLHMIEDLFCCLYPTGDRAISYPLFILDYKHAAVQAELDTLLKIPTIPCGLKALIQKVKNGTLATKKEMAYMEGYRQFRKTHFTLYETIPPRE